MISERLFNELNKQTNYEFSSAHLYLAMQAYCEAQDLAGFSNFFKVQVEEERFHAMRFFDYIYQMNGRVTIASMEEPANEFGSILELFRETLKHEQEITQRVYNLMNIATDEREHATISFLKWFIDEQVEEETTVTNVIKRLERIGNDPAALYMLDQELAQRTFTPPVNV